MSNPEGSVPKRKFKKWQIFLLFIVGLMVIGQFTSPASNSPTSTTSVVADAPTSTSVDVMTKRSCRDWYAVISEGGKGVQTDAELRDGLKKVYDVARYSEDSDIVSAATRQLAAVTAGDTAAFETAATDFGNACQRHGQ